LVLGAATLAAVASMTVAAQAQAPAAPVAGAPTIPPNVAPAAAAPLATAPAIDMVKAKGTFEQSCNGCHESSLASGMRLSRAGWREIIERMTGFGLAVSEEEANQIQEYLAVTYPAP
jgi:cytochrome c5